MHRYWNNIIRPVLEKHEASKIVEIGCLYGNNTHQLVEYCYSKKGLLYAIDPFPQFDVDKIVEQYKDNFKLYRDLSLSVLPIVENFDAILIDGDHNWYTVFNELKIIEAKFPKNPPIIFVHDVGWPYARRDLYYNPENIPPIYRHPYKQAEISPNSHLLVENGGINGHLNNSIYENNPQNGVLTAIDDFVEQSKLCFEFFLFSGFNGLGVLVSKEYPELIEYIIDEMPVFTSKLVATMEDEQIQQNVKLNVEKKKNKELHEKVTQLTKENLVKEKEIQSWNEKYQLLDKEFTELKEKHQFINKELQKQSEKNIQLHNDFSQVENKLRDVKAELEGLKKSSEQQKEHIAKLLKEKETELKEYRTKVYKKEKNLERDLEVANRAVHVHLNSMRYQLGDSLISSLSSPKRLIKLPVSLIKLLVKARRKKSIRGNQIHTPINRKEHTEMEKKSEIIEKPNFNVLNKESITHMVFNPFFSNATSIIIPVYNAFDDFVNCIESVERHTPIPHELIIINDCSTDDRVKSYLENRRSPNFIVIHNETNLGYVESVNVGIRSSKSDVVLLNSDTIVTSRWLEKLKYAAYYAENVGTVTPLSNAAGAFSVPNSGEVNEIPCSLGIEGMAKLVENISRRVYPAVPTGNGFCMYIKRGLINEIGLLDSIRFKRGYGEENDFCMRALKAGWINIIDDSTYIYHKRSASFSDEKNDLITRNRAVLDKLHPEYTKLVKDAFNSEEIKRIRSTVALSLESVEVKHLDTKRILYVLHDGSGGTPNTNKDLMSYVEAEYDCFVLTSNKKKITLFEYKDSVFSMIKSWDLKEEWEITKTTRDDFREIYLEILVQWDISLVHIRHLLAHTFDIAFLANKMGRKIILSFHDFYFICPTIHLLDNNYTYCSGACTEGMGNCSPPSSWILNPPVLKHNWVYVWRGLVEELFKVCDAFVTTSQSTKDVYVKIYPNLSDHDFRIIEHGRDNIVEFEPDDDFHSEPIPGEPIKILVPGNIGMNKGAEFIQQLKKIDTENKLEIHFLGNIQSSLKEYGIVHGPYQRHEFSDRVKDIKPSFVGIFSIWPETYCHTLTEAWQCRIPVLASKIGTIEERINNTGCGWFIDFSNPQESYKRIIEISGNIEEYRIMIEKLKFVNIRTAKEMSNDYIELYNEVSTNQ